MLMRFFYSLFFYLLLPLILLRLWIKSFSSPTYARRWAERFGYVKFAAKDKKAIWIHTVSVGEFLGALPLIRELQKNYDYALYITTTTVTGSERVNDILGEAVGHSYAPYDLPGSVSRFIKKIKPEVLVIMETELWPNLIAKCKQLSVPTILINARLSEKSAKGYARFSWLTRPMLQDLSFAVIQNSVDAQRFYALGLDGQKSQVVGNLKFDISISDSLQTKVDLLKQEWDSNEEGLIIIAASTHQGEDEIVLQAFAKVRAAENIFCRNARLILVPRHPERFDSVAQLIQQNSWKMARRSEGQSLSHADILLGDTMGELMLLYGVSHMAFVGGSLIPRGGHNFIEPAAWSLPLQSGEHLFNFSEVSQLMMEAQALSIAKDADDLAKLWIQLLTNKEERHKTGAAANSVVMNNRGALEKTLEIIGRMIAAEITAKK